MMKKIILLVPLLVFGVVGGIAVAQTEEPTTGTVTACASATASIPDREFTGPTHTLSRDGTDIYTEPGDVVQAPGDTDTQTQCETVTYTVPTITVTTTPPPPPIDTEPPAKPVLSLGPVTQTSMTLNWQAGVDNVGVDHYNVYLDGVEVGETNELTWTYTGLTCGTFYNQGLTVEDAAGNTSILSQATWGRSTLACDPPPPPPPSDNVANLWVDTNGGSCVRSATPVAYDDATACAGLNAAYQASGTSCGDTVNIRSGDYSVLRVMERASLSSCTQDVVFRTNPGDDVNANVLAFSSNGNGVTDGADHVTFEGPADLLGGVDCMGDCTFITVDNVNGGTVALSQTGPAGTAHHLTYKNSDFGPCVSSGGPAGQCSTISASGQITVLLTSDVSFINNTIHDYDTVCPGGVCDHYECVRTASPNNMLWRGNKFWNCEIYGLSTTNWSGTNIIENNWFGASNEANGTTPRRAGITADPTIPGTILVRNNSFSSVDGIYSDAGEDHARWTITGNLIGNPNPQCFPNAVYKYNFYPGSKCGDSTNIGFTVFPYVNPSRGADMNYHLIGPFLGDNYVPTNCAATDVDGQNRSVPCDAGSDER